MCLFLCPNRTLNFSIYKAINSAYRQVTEKMGFDIDAGQNIDMSKSIKETINDTVNYIDNGNKGCCFHASVYLTKLLHDINVDSEIILTLEPTPLENGEVRNDMRASVLVHSDEKDYVLNPIEDIEFFEAMSIISEERKKYYDGTSTALIGIKNNIFSPDAAHIDLEDFINRYGNGTAWTIGSLYGDDFENATLGTLMSNAKIIEMKAKYSKL